MESPGHSLSFRHWEYRTTEVPRWAEIYGSLGFAFSLVREMSRNVISHVGGASNQSGCVGYILHSDQDVILQRVNQENQPSCTAVFRHLSDD